MAIIQVNLHQPAPPVKNWRILLVQTFTAHMPLLTATSAFGLGEDAGVLNSAIYTVFILYVSDEYKRQSLPDQLIEERDTETSSALTLLTTDRPGPGNH